MDAVGSLGKWGRQGGGGGWGTNLVPVGAETSFDVFGGHSFEVDICVFELDSRRMARISRVRLGNTRRLQNNVSHPQHQCEKSKLTVPIFISFNTLVNSPAPAFPILSLTSSNIGPSCFLLNFSLFPKSTFSMPQISPVSIPFLNSFIEMTHTPDSGSWSMMLYWMGEGPR